MDNDGDVVRGEIFPRLGLVDGLLGNCCSPVLAAADLGDAALAEVNTKLPLVIPWSFIINLVALLE